MVFNPFKQYTSSGNPFETVSLARPNSILPSVSYTPLNPIVNTTALTPVEQVVVPRVGPRDDERPYDVFHRPTNENPWDVLRRAWANGFAFSPAQKTSPNVPLMADTTPTSQANLEAAARYALDRRREEAEANRAQAEANRAARQAQATDQGNFRQGGQGIHRNMGGLVYAQEGLPVVPGQEEIPGQPIEPIAPLPMLEQAHMAPEMPSELPMMPKKSFAEKVAEAKAYIEGKPSDISATPMSMMTDGQGDGGIYGDVEYSQEELAPDIGPDTVDAKLTPGEAVIPAEAVADQPELVNGLIQHGRDIQAFNKGGISAKVSKIYKEGYTAPGQAYAIAKSMGYNEGGLIAYGNKYPRSKQYQGFSNSPMYAQTGLVAGAKDFLNDPRRQAVGQFVYESSLPGAGASTALTDYDSNLIANETSGNNAKEGELFEAFDENNQKIFAQAFNRPDGTVKFISGGQEYNSLAEIPGVASTWERAAGTSIGETQAKNFDDIYREELKEMNTGLQAAKQIKRKAGQIVSIIKNNIKDFGAGVFRGGGIRSWIQTAERLTGVQFDALIGDSPAVSSVNAILKSQLIDLVAAARARGTTFGAMTEAEWRLLGEQLGDITDSVGGVYAIQKYLLDASDVDISAIEARINWWKEQSRNNNYQADLSDFDLNYDSEGDRATVTEARNSAIAEGRQINSGINPDKVEKVEKDVKVSAITIPSDVWNRDLLKDIKKISDNELPKELYKDDYIQRPNVWGRDVYAGNKVYQWFTGGESILPERNSWRSADASVMVNAIQADELNEDIN